MCVYVVSKLAQKRFASPLKTSSNSNTITETYIDNHVSMRWDLSFNLIPFMLQNGEVMDTQMTWSQFWKVAPNDRYARMYGYWLTRERLHTSNEHSF